MTELKVIRRIPYRANPIFKGMVNIRGELQLCMSMHKLLGFEEPTNLDKDAAAKRRLAVTEKDRARWVFPVDEILGLVRCSPDELIKPPVTVSKAASPHVKFVLQKNDRQIGVLDEELTFYQLSRSVQ
jgi:chemotaxis-related protein WspD